MIPVPENLTSISMGILPRTGAGVRLLQPPPAHRCESWSRGCPELGTAQGRGCGALGRQSSCCAEATPGHAAVPGQRVGRRGQGGWVLSCSLLVAGSDPLDGGNYGVRELLVYFCLLACGSQRRRRRWPCGQGMPSIKVPSEPVELQGKRCEGQEGVTKCMETPPGSGDAEGKTAQ